MEGYNPNSYKYDLYGVCNHMGTSRGGHYTAFVKANSGQWYPPFSPEALLFDIRMLVSGLCIVILYDIRRRLWQTAYREV